MKKVLLLGSSGMAGQILKLELQKRPSNFSIVDISRSDKISKPTIQMDVSNFAELGEIINRYNFDFIINCVGVLNSAAEKNPDQAVLINSYLPHFLEKLTSRSQTKIIHISTDCVFSGNAGGYVENDLKDGVGFYAQSKAIGELINEKDLTIRTSIIGPDLNSNGIGLFQWLLKQKGLIDGYTAAFWSGITTIELTRVIIELMNRPTLPVGLIHLTNNVKISKYSLLKIIKDIFNLKQVEIVESGIYEVDKSLLNTREDLDLEIPSYQEMILSMKEWMKINDYI